MSKNNKFVADVSRFASLTDDKLTRVMRQSVQDTMSIAQLQVSKGGNMPVDLGNLINSLVSELDGAKIAEGENSYEVAIGMMKPGQVARFAWGGPAASYAIVRHYKPPSFGQGGGMWRDKAAQQWQSIVENNARRVK